MNLFDEYPVGHREVLGEYTFTADRIIEFARKYDPQPFHLSEEGAQGSLFDRLCASGWHTGSVWMRLRVDAVKREAEKRIREGRPPIISGPSPGIKSMKWPYPVYAGDTITFSSTVTGARETKSRPGWAVVAHANEGINEDGRQVFAFEGVVFIKM